MIIELKAAVIKLISSRKNYAEIELATKIKQTYLRAYSARRPNISAIGIIVAGNAAGINTAKIFKCCF